MFKETMEEKKRSRRRNNECNYSHMKNASDQLYQGGYQEFGQYLTLVMINDKAEERCEFEIIVNIKAKSEIWQHCKFVK